MKIIEIEKDIPDGPLKDFEDGFEPMLYTADDLERVRRETIQRVRAAGIQNGTSHVVTTITNKALKAIEEGNDEPV